MMGSDAEVGQHAVCCLSATWAESSGLSPETSAVDVSQGGALLGDSSIRSCPPVSALSLCLAERMFLDPFIGENKIT